MQNEKIKYLKKLMSNKAYVFFDNPKILQEAYDAGHKIAYIIKKEGVIFKADYGGEILEVSENVFKAFSTTVNSQGIIGVVEFKNLELKKPQGNFLVLDNLQDPGNVGTLIRSALGANFLDVYLLDCAKVTNDKVVRSSMGAVLKTRCYQTTKQEFLQRAKEWNLNFAVCDMEGEDIYKTTLPQPIGIIVGNEGRGVSERMYSLATKTIKIPMQNGLESLNAGVSGSIVMYCISNAMQ